MLYLKRKIGDTVHIGEGADEIVITIDKMSHGEVNLGIQAPRAVSIDRGEVRRKQSQGEINGNK